MDMSQTVESKDISSLEQTIAELLASVAAEEISLANLINATAETIQTLSCLISNSNHHSQAKEIDYLYKSITKTLETVIMKEWILSKKLDNIFEIITDSNEKNKIKSKSKNKKYKNE